MTGEPKTLGQAIWVVLGGSVMVVAWAFQVLFTDLRDTMQQHREAMQAITAQVHALSLSVSENRMRVEGHGRSIEAAWGRINHLLEGQNDG